MSLTLNLHTRKSLTNVYINTNFILKYIYFIICFYKVENILFYQRVNNIVLGLFLFLRVRCTFKKLVKLVAIFSCKFAAMCMSFSFASLSFTGTQIPILLHFSNFFFLQCRCWGIERDDLTDQCV